MSRFRVRRFLFWLLSVFLLAMLVRRADAAPESEKAARRTPRIVPPVPTSLPEAKLPEGIELSAPTSVLLELEIDTEGKVTSARAIGNRVPPLDRAAEEAARWWVFAPARRDGEPIPVRIRYEYWFEPITTATEPPSQLAPQTNWPSSRPASDPVEAPVSPPSSEVLSAEASGPSSQPPADEGFGAVAEVEAPPREVTRYTIPRQALQKVPGTGGDALRAIEVLPGVARTGVWQGDPILRGAAYNESRSFIEGDSVPLLFHFGGVKSAFNSELLERVDLYPSNFSSRFGRATGGVLEAKVRDPRRDRAHGVVDLSLLDSMAVLETPVGERAAVAVGARRSNLDLFFDQFVPKDAFRVVAAPVYWDYQAMATYQNSQHALRVLGYGSHDRLRLLFSEPSSLDPGLRGSIGATVEYHRVQAALTSRLGPGVQQRTQVTFGTFLGDEKFGDLESRFDVYEVFGRSEWNLAVAHDLSMNLGFDFEGTFLKGRYQGPQAPQTEGNSDYADASYSSFETKRIDGRLEILRPAAYVELVWHPTAALTVVPGLRTDYDAFISAGTVNPRLASRARVLSESYLKWGVGLYSQSPEYHQSIPGFGNSSLRPYHALHASAGVEQYFGEELRLGCEGFFKRLFDRVVMTPGGVPPVYLNEGQGRIYGLELSARLRTGDTTGYLAYTLSRSERQDRNDTWRLFDLDQTHILVMTASRDLGKGWLIGGRFRLISGNPYTPVFGAVYDAGIDTYRPIHGTVNSARGPLFHQLDLRIEKKWLIGRGSVAGYLDLQNAYNAQHVEGSAYSFDYTRRQNVYGIPIIPNLGVRGEL